jgi:hypothetical protein
MIKEFVGVAILCAAGLYAQTAPSPTPDSWGPLQFLVGTWGGTTQGGSAGAAGSGLYSFQPELRNHILARHSSSTGCKGPADFDCDHADLLYVYRDVSGQPYRAIYFDNEGHVIHYDVSTPTPTTAVFLSDSSQTGPQFRLSYELKGATMYGKFQVRPPGQTEFKTYLEWSGDKK